MNKKRNQELCVEELVKQRPILTEKEMESFMTYEEICSEAKRLFDEAVNNIWKEYDSHKTK